jgi:hypothetical protein
MLRFNKLLTIKLSIHQVDTLQELLLREGVEPETLLSGDSDQQLFAVLKVRIFKNTLDSESASQKQMRYGLMHILILNLKGSLHIFFFCQIQRKLCFTFCN